jgi:hypothetical protein
LLMQLYVHAAMTGGHQLIIGRNRLSSNGQQKHRRYKTQMESSKQFPPVYSIQLELTTR